VLLYMNNCYRMYYDCIGIYLWILGQADVAWPDQHQKSKMHFDYEIYMKECVNIWGQGQIGVDIII